MLSRRPPFAYLNAVNDLSSSKCQKAGNVIRKLLP